MKALAMVALLVAAAQAGPARVGPGIYRPMFPASPAEREIAVRAFWLDREPVTNAEYLAFVRANPTWRRDRVKPLFADAGYLAGWATSDDPGALSPRAPVVRVSWFAARAYCAWRGGRLPGEAEWELAAAADSHRRDASDSPELEAQLLAWYSRPTPPTLPDIGGRPNAWGVSDLYGLVWEWTEDFSAALVTSDASDQARSKCGAEAVAARNPRAYAAFMRFAFRGALQARDTVSSLGFRCAYDQEPSR